MKAENKQMRNFRLAAMQIGLPESLADWERRFTFPAISNEFKAILTTRSGVGIG